MAYLALCLRVLHLKNVPIVLYWPLKATVLSLIGRIVGVILLTGAWVKLFVCKLTHTVVFWLCKAVRSSGIMGVKGHMLKHVFQSAVGRHNNNPYPSKIQPPPFSACHSVPIRGHSQPSQLCFLPMCILTHTHARTDAHIRMHTHTDRKGNISYWQCLHSCTPQHGVLQSTRGQRRSHTVDQFR